MHPDFLVDKINHGGSSSNVPETAPTSILRKQAALKVHDEATGEDERINTLESFQSTLEVQALLAAGYKPDSLLLNVDMHQAPFMGSKSLVINIPFHFSVRGSVRRAVGGK
ncbi:UNVERIFIED_CONTAM: hypothetical protein Slati_2908100 [Sesamum latifolium]|uniref:Uncharacterized protein n=1 Tax=Sesamum latifolium TaxID=2727402 RepID=A0AAW2VDP6_9LAMI